MVQRSFNMRRVMYVLEMGLEWTRAWMTCMIHAIWVGKHNSFVF